MASQDTDDEVPLNVLANQQQGVHGQSTSAGHPAQAGNTDDPHEPPTGSASPTDGREDPPESSKAKDAEVGRAGRRRGAKGKGVGPEGDGGAGQQGEQEQGGAGEEGRRHSTRNRKQVERYDAKAGRKAHRHASEEPAAPKNEPSRGVKKGSKGGSKASNKDKHDSGDESEQGSGSDADSGSESEGGGREGGRRAPQPARKRGVRGRSTAAREAGKRQGRGRKAVVSSGSDDESAPSSAEEEAEEEPAPNRRGKGGKGRGGSREKKQETPGADGQAKQGGGQGLPGSNAKRGRSRHSTGSGGREKEGKHHGADQDTTKQTHSSVLEPGSEAYKALAVMQKLEEYDKALAMYEAAWEKTKEAVRVVEGLARSWLEVPFGQLRQPDVAQRLRQCKINQHPNTLAVTDPGLLEAARACREVMGVLRFMHKQDTVGDGKTPMEYKAAFVESREAAAQQGKAGAGAGSRPAGAAGGRGGAGPPAAGGGSTGAAGVKREGGAGAPERPAKQPRVGPSDVEGGKQEAAGPGPATKLEVGQSGRSTSSGVGTGAAMISRTLLPPAGAPAAPQGAADTSAGAPASQQGPGSLPAAVAGAGVGEGGRQVVLAGFESLRNETRDKAVALIASCLQPPCGFLVTPVQAALAVEKLLHERYAPGGNLEGANGDLYKSKLHLLWVLMGDDGSSREDGPGPSSGARNKDRAGGSAGSIDRGRLARLGDGLRQLVLEGVMRPEELVAQLDKQPMQ